MTIFEMKITPLEESAGAGRKKRPTAMPPCHTHPFVIEFLGAAGSGKSTLSRALVGKLIDDGFAARLVSSDRPSEQAPGNLVASRSRALSNPLARMSKIFTAFTANDETGAQLLNALPPRNYLWKLRYRRYFARLSRAISKDLEEKPVTLIDQGYITAICSLAAVSRLSSSLEGYEAICRALAIVPVPQLVIFIDTPGEILDKRLKDRLSRQSRLERIFELDHPSIVDQRRFTETVGGLLKLRKIPCVRVRGENAAQLDEAIQQIPAAIKRIMQEREA
jgi:thymidylate kinase